MVVDGSKSVIANSFWQRFIDSRLYVCTREYLHVSSPECVERYEPNHHIPAGKFIRLLVTFFILYMPGIELAPY